MQQHNLIFQNLAGKLNSVADALSRYPPIEKGKESTREEEEEVENFLTLSAEKKQKKVILVRRLNTLIYNVIDQI